LGQRDLHRHNGVWYSHEYFDAAIAKMLTFLKTT